MAIVGIDFGNFSSYVSMVKTGGIDTVDNEYSYRATPCAVSFTNVIRQTGNSAHNQRITNWKNTFLSFKNLIGLEYDDPISQYEMQISGYNFIKLEDGFIGVEAEYLGEKKIFTISQLAAMMITHLLDVALRHSPKLSDVVLSVPNYFSESQFRSFVSSCAIASFEPRTVINDIAAISFTYSLFKTDFPADGQPPRHVAFVDVGYSGTQVAIVAFTQSTVQIVASVGTNRIGGRNFDAILFHKFAEEFNKKFKKDIYKNRKSSLKLLTECEILKKKINSMVTEIPLKLECLMDDLDFMSKSSREEFDSLAQEYYQHFKSLLESAIEESKISIDSIHSIELTGGSSRIIGLRNIVSSVFGKDPKTTLNGDEAVSRGCAIQAALLSPSIKIREIKIKDCLNTEYIIVYNNKKNELKELKIFKFNETVPNTKEIVFPPFNDFSFIIRAISKNNNQVDIAECNSFGKTAETCEAEKLIFCIEINSCGVVKISRVYFVQNKRIEETPTESTEDQKEDQKPSVKISKVNHDLDFFFNYFKTFHSNLTEFQSLEKNMILQIKNEKKRSESKNTLEEFIYTSRTALEDSLNIFCSPEENNHIQQQLRLQQDWLYDEGDNSTTLEYTNRLESLNNLISPIKLRFETYKRLETTFNQLESLILKYRNYYDSLNNNHGKYSHINPDDVTQYFNFVSSAQEFVIQTGNMVKNCSKTQLPSITVKDVEKKISELTEFCEKFISKAENPPPPPKEPTPEESTSTPKPTDAGSPMDCEEHMQEEPTQ